MLLKDLGAEIYKSWSNAQKRDEIEKLVQGYRSGLPAFILCRMAEAIAGDRKKARKYLHEMMTAAEREVAVNSETGHMSDYVRNCLL